MQPWITRLLLLGAVLLLSGGTTVAGPHEAIEGHTTSPPTIDTGDLGKTTGADRAEGGFVIDETYGGDAVRAVAATDDGGYLLAISSRNRIDQSTPILVAVDANGTELWRKHYDSGDAGVRPADIARTPDGDYVVVGTWDVPAETVTDPRSDPMKDFWVMRVDETGDEQWRTTVGGLWDEYVGGVAVDSDGTVIVAGETMSHIYDHADRTGIEASGNGWIVAFDANGNELWDRTYATLDSGIAEFNDVVSAPDGGYLAVGSQIDAGAWAVKVDGQGRFQWEEHYSHHDGTVGEAVTRVPGGYALTGWTYGDDVHDSFVAVLNDSQRPNRTRFDRLVPGRFLTGAGTSQDGDVLLTGQSGIESDTDLWIGEVDAASGTLQYGRELPESGRSFGLDVLGTTDGTNVAAGRSASGGGWLLALRTCYDTGGQPDNDDDGDGLCDNWETEGIDADLDGEVDLDLPAMGATRDHKDVFVEIDYMTGPGYSAKPASESLAAVRDAFADAPVDAPVDETGIRLHTVVDEELPHRPGIDFGAGSGFHGLKNGGDRCGTSPSDGHFGTRAERASENCEATLDARAMVFRYAIFAHSHADGDTLGQADLPGDDLLVTIDPAFKQKTLAVARNTHNYEYIESTTVLDEFVHLEGGTFMHELGHTLDLRHGGDEHVNQKPNYMSVMNYNFDWLRQGWSANLPGVPDRVPVRLNADLDFSDEALPELDEGALREADGIRGPSGKRTVYSPNTTAEQRAGEGNWFVGPSDGPIDWNGDGEIAGIVAANVNDDANESGAFESSKYGGYDDWSSLQYNHRDSAFYEGRKTTGIEALEIPEPTASEFFDASLGGSDVDDDAVANHRDTCPLVADPQQEDSDGDGWGDACQGDTEPPEPSFTVEHDGRTIAVDGTGTADDGGVLAYRWEFGDGTVALGPETEHTFAEAGTYNVTLTVTDDRYTEARTSHEVTVTEEPQSAGAGAVAAKSSSPVGIVPVALALLAGLLGTGFWLRRW